MSNQPNEHTPPTSTPSDMPTMLTTRKRRAQHQDENTSTPVKATSAPASTTLAFTKSCSGILNRQPSAVSFFRKPSVATPSRSQPAPPVVTTSLAAIESATNRLHEAKKEEKEEPRLGKRLRPSIVAKERERQRLKNEQLQEVVMGPSLWTSLLNRDKGVISQTFDLDLLQRQSSPFSATMITPKMLRDGLKTDETGFHAWKAAKRAIDESFKSTRGWRLGDILPLAMEYYLVALGVELLEAVPGPHFTFIDPRCYDDTKAIVRRALRLMRLFAAEGHRRDRLVITIPATEAGVFAAKQLEEKHQVRTNLTLVSGLGHAAVCAQAAASFVTFPYALMRDVFVYRNTNTSSQLFARVMEMLNPSSKRLADDAIESTGEYYDKHGLKTRVLLSLTGMPALSEAQQLNGFAGVVLDGDQSQQAKLAMPVAPPAPTQASRESSQAKARAREAHYHYLSSHLSSVDGAFSVAMSAETRGVAQATLERGLTYDNLQMEKATRHMLQFLQGEAQLAHLDSGALEELYKGDVFEKERMTRLMDADITPQQLAPIRNNEVGFRMASSSWDKSEEV